MALSPEHRRFLVVEQGIGGVVVNFLLNGAIAWALFRSAARVPLWGESSIAGDTIATSFLLPLLTCLIVTRIVQRQLEQGRVPPVMESPTRGWIQRLASLPTLRRAVVLGLAGIVVAALPTLAWFGWAGPEELSFEAFLWFKAGFAALLAAAFAPLIAWLALVSPSGRRHGA